MTIASIEIPVASALFPAMAPVIVKVTNAPNYKQAVRIAEHYAAKFQHVAGPIVRVTEHELAMQRRQEAIAQFAPKMPSLRSTSGMCFDCKYGNRN